MPAGAGSDCFMAPRVQAVESALDDAGPILSARRKRLRDRSHLSGVGMCSSCTTAHFQRLSRCRGSLSDEVRGGAIQDRLRPTGGLGCDALPLPAPRPSVPPRWPTPLAEAPAAEGREDVTVGLGAGWRPVLDHVGRSVELATAPRTPSMFGGSRSGVSGSPHQPTLLDSEPRTSVCGAHGRSGCGDP